MNAKPAHTIRRSRLRALATAMTVGALAGIPAASNAADTEIYLGIEELGSQLEEPFGS